MLGWASAASGQVPGSPSPQARYLRAVAIAQEGKLGSASEELELLARTSSSLADRCSYEAGLLFERRAALRKAGDLFAAVSERSYFFPEARLALARVRRLHGDLNEAAAAVVPLTSSPVRLVRRRALVELSTLAQLEHDERGAREALTSLAADRARWLGGAPVLAVITGSYDSLIHRNACRDAKRVAQRASPELGCSTRLFAAEASACIGQDVSVELRQIVRECPQPQLASRAWMTLGMLQARDGKVEASAATFREVATVAPATSLAAEALFTAFWVGWRAHPAESSGEDLARLEALPVEFSTQDRARIRYWRARVALARGAAVEAVSLLAEVALLYPATYYGHLARERLAALDGARASAVELSSVIPAQSEASEERQALERLEPGIASLQLGLEDGASELTALALRQPCSACNRVVVEVLNAAGASGLAYRFARAVFREQAGDRQDATVWQAAFPTPFSELIALHADEASVAPDLLQGLVREESAFDPAARSRCGALGLMQLMPVTARGMAIEGGTALEKLSDLLDPQRNVQLGSRYLGQLLRRFDGNRAAAAAAYNGGPTRVAGWLKQAGAGQLEEWVEEIPLDETRNYVKDVLASADVYRYRLAARSVIVASVTQPTSLALP